MRFLTMIQQRMKKMSVLQLNYFHADVSMSTPKINYINILQTTVYSISNVYVHQIPSDVSTMIKQVQQ